MMIPNRPPVALVRCDDYDPQQVEEALRRALDLLGGISHYVRPGQRVVLKPNLLRAMAPAVACTTHPAVVRAAVRLVQEAGATAVIADSPGGPSARPWLRRVFETTGMRQVAEETGAELSYDTTVVHVSHPDGRLLKMVEVIAPVVQADAVINLAKFKTHNLTVLTAAVKNLFGVVPGLDKMGYHAKLYDRRMFAQGLVDVATCVRPTLSITDGIVAMEGDGPSGGRPFPGRALLASPDMFAADVVAMGLAGWDPLTMPTLSVAAEWGLTTGQLADVELRGDPLAGLLFQGFRPGSATVVDPGLVPRGLQEQVRSPACRVGGAGRRRLPGALRRWATRQLIVTPQAGRRCTGCGHCAQLCPVQAIHVRARRAEIDARRCIRCYCCHELCPELAVELDRPWLGRLLQGR